MNNILHEFEDFEKGNSRFKNTTILLIAILITGFWVVFLVNLFSSGHYDRDFTDLYILTGGTLVIGVIVYLFAKSNKIGWFLLSLFISFLLGLFTNSVVTMKDYDFHENPEAWRDALLIVMFCNTLAAFILLIHVKTKKRLSISSIMYITCIALCCIVSVGSYLLIS